MSAPAERLKMTETWRQWEGEVVDRRFPLQRFLGSSDHSAVFLTVGGQPPQKAVLKFVEANPATAQAQLSRWERVAKLSHPHLIRLLHFGRCQLGGASMLYVVSEFAEENLSQILPVRPLNPSEAEYMLRSTLEALAYLHGQGLVQGRLKPGNIMAVGEQLKIASDAICKSGEKNLGGPPTVYDAPEVTTSGLSPAGDVWSLGITLVESLTQRPSVGEGIRQADPSLPDSVPPPFLEIARQCLRLDPQRRWTVPDIAARLLPTAPPPRNLRSKYLVAVAAVVLVVGALVVGPRVLRTNSRVTPPSIAEPAKATATDKPLANPPTSAAPPASSNKASTPSDPPPATPPAKYTPPPKKAPVASPTSVPGAVALQVMPPVSARSRNTITGKVRVTVRVNVDTAGKVVEAHLEAPGPSQYFAKQALDASRHWTFTAPEREGAPVASEWFLRYQFGRAKTEVQPTQISPRQ
jgi:TonB family protein